ncbi:MAG TPA: ABC transporter permease [Egibacteraceae bacterium]|nr:ABC transporter permease [Egibacteraceae bacterium]
MTVVRDKALQIIEPPGGWGSLRMSDLWRGRELLAFLTWRDIKVRYTQAFLGVLWAVLQPVLMMVVFTLFFGRVARLPSDGLPYAVFALSGLVPWTFFANAVGSSTESLLADKNLVSKVYFPRLIIPLASLLSWLPDLLIGTLILLALSVLYGVAPAVTVLVVPLLAVLAAVVAASVSVWLSALNVAYRDVRFAVRFLLQLWLFATPVIYPASFVPAAWRWVLGLNPMTGLTETFRWAVFGRTAAPLGLLVLSVAVSTVVLAAGVVYFRRVEANFADVI